MKQLKSTLTAIVLLLFSTQLYATIYEDGTGSDSGLIDDVKLEKTQNQTISNVQIAKPILNADKETYSVTVKWDGAKNAKTWLYVYENNTTDPKLDASNHSYTYSKLLGGYTFDLYVQIEDGLSVIKKTFRTPSKSTIPIKKYTTIPFDKYKSFDSSRIIKDSKGLVLKSNIQSNVDNTGTTPDIVYSVKVKEKGLYVIETNSSLNDIGKQALDIPNSTKYDSLFMKLQIGKNDTKRVIYVPWQIDEEDYRSILGKFDLESGVQDIKIWLPQGVILKKIVIRKYIPPAVPKNAQSYEPSIIPPQTRPRLLVNASTIKTVRNNLTVRKNKAIWKEVKTKAKKPYTLPFSAGQKINKRNLKLEKIARSKAFYYLMRRDRAMEKDKAIGRQAIDITKKYIEALEFGNILGVEREIGGVLYNASLIYDWCYDLLAQEDKDFFVNKFKTLARDMELEWPPFRIAVTYGHGNESELSQVMLAMSIAIYDEDSTPYKYTSYRVLEELAPFKKFEYQSPRHVQGAAYGPFRYRFDLTAGLLFKKMSDSNNIFDPNIFNIYKGFWYSRLTNKSAFADGDDFAQYSRYIKVGILPVIYNNYSRNFNTPITKLAQNDMVLGNLHKGGTTYEGLVGTLLLSDPYSDNYKLLTEEEISKILPLTSFTGKATGSMTARTGWDLSENTNDVVVDIKGGGYKLGNHQHADAGSLQISYKGLQVADLGQYKYYGTPYDMNFSKRSISHSMMLVVKPGETITASGHKIKIEDGGTKQFSHPFPPATPEMAKRPEYSRGQVISESTAPENVFDPDFSYYALDLASAYTDKISAYQKKSVFINLKNEDIPAVLLMLDTITTSNADFKKYWQINTLNKPNIDKGIITLTNQRGGDTGNVVVNMLKPSKNERDIKLLSGEDSRKVFDSNEGKPYPAPFPDKPEAKGTRIMVSPSVPSQYDEFLTAFTMKKPGSPNLPISYQEASDKKTLHVFVGDKILVVMNKENLNLQSNIPIKIANNGTKLFVSGLQEGKWTLTGGKKVTVKKGKNSAYFENLSAGNYTLVYNR